MRNRIFLPIAVLIMALAGCKSSGSPDTIMKGESAPAPATLGVNAYLWQASLETLSFLSLRSVDPFGGVIVSDWYAPPASPDERLKVTVHIMDRALNADGLKVMVFGQVRRGGDWQNIWPSPEVSRKLEDAILTRARELRLRQGVKTSGLAKGEVTG